MDLDMNIDLNIAPIDTNMGMGHGDASTNVTFVGMQFNNLEESKLFFESYSREIGFGVRIRSTKKNKNGVQYYRQYVCYKEGEKQPDARTENSRRNSIVRCNCGVFMTVQLVKDSEIYQVTSFNGEHNHPLEGNGTVPFISSHRSINPIKKRVIDIAENAGMGVTKTYRYLSLQAGGSQNVGFIPEDMRTYLRKKDSIHRQAGDGGVVIDYFREKSTLCSSFFHDMQVDHMDQIVNFFWADSKMIVDYQAFGDVISFDTTFGTNKDSRPLGIFSGFNNHRETVIFGVTLLYDETTSSFEWVFETFLRCHGYKIPGIIFTDQDLAMKSALESKMPSVRHCLCSWHIIQNAMKNMARVVNPNMKSFIADLSCCMFSKCKIEEFEKMWKEMVEKYKLVENNWINELYGKKTKWSIAYRMGLFTAGVRSTQLSESVNSSVKKDLGGGATMRKFFMGFDSFLESTRNRELRTDCASRQTFPHLPVENARLLKHAAQVYTPKAFILFRKQWDKAHNIHLDENNPIQGPHVRNAFYGEKKFEIKFDPELMIISCACCRFEMHGFLCAHILRVFDICRVHEIPENYITKRWTRYARSGFTLVDRPPIVLTNSQIIDKLSFDFNGLIHRAIVNRDPTCIKRIENFINNEHELYDKMEISLEKENEAPIDPSVRVFGLKKNDRPKGGRKRRYLSFLEKGKSSKVGQKNKKAATTQECTRLTNSEIISGAAENLTEENILLTLRTLR